MLPYPELSVDTELASMDPGPGGLWYGTHTYSKITIRLSLRSQYAVIDQQGETKTKKTFPVFSAIWPVSHLTYQPFKEMSTRSGNDDLKIRAPSPKTPFERTFYR